jgi:hypothetical protein
MIGDVLQTTIMRQAAPRTTAKSSANSVMP